MTASSDMKFRRSSRCEMQFPYNGKEEGEWQHKPRSYLYKKLIDVTFYHNFYNGNDNLCTAFTVYPTAETADIIKRLGFIFHSNESSFSILFDEEKQRITNNITKYLLRNDQQPEDETNTVYTWKRLSFVIALSDPYFLNFTALPPTTNSVKNNLYYSNIDKEKNKGVDLLDTDEAVGLLYRKPKHPVPTVPVQYAIPVNSTVERVDVYNISYGTENPEKPVLSYPRCVPYGLVSEIGFSNISYDDLVGYCIKHGIDLNNKTYCVDIIDDINSKAKRKTCFVCTNTIYVDFSTIEEGKYSIVKSNKDNEILSTETVIYTEDYPIPLNFIDILFAQPSPEKAGVYPVVDLSGTPEKPKGSIESTNYIMKFKTRETTWWYYVIPSDFDSYTDLSITTTLNDNIYFDGPTIEIIDNGSKAFLFTSREKLKLLEQSTYRFQLKGKHYLNFESKILLNPLSAATNQQLWTSPDTNGYVSKIYVYI